jgi:hypothetical protein
MRNFPNAECLAVAVLVVVVTPVPVPPPLSSSSPNLATGYTRTLKPNRSSSFAAPPPAVIDHQLGPVQLPRERHASTGRVREGYPMTRQYASVEPIALPGGVRVVVVVVVIIVVRLTILVGISERTLPINPLISDSSTGHDSDDSDALTRDDTSTMMKRL